MPVTRLLPVLLATLWCAGCSVVGVKIDRPSETADRRIARTLAAQSPDDRAAQALLMANSPRQAPSEKLSSFLEAARLTQGAASGTPAGRINRTATREIVSLLAARKFQVPAGPPGSAPLTIAGQSAPTLDPRLPEELVAADAIHIKKLPTRVTQEGAGVPYVARFAPRSPLLQGQPGIPPLAGICEPVTALLRFDRATPQLVFYRTLKDDDVVIAGRRTKLAADFSAPLAYLVSQGRNRNIDLRALLRVDKNMDHAGLYQFSTYDPGKIPVVMVHGLMSRPETWVPALNQLMADEQVRERYQFWFYLYPTGLPVWASAAKLRGELDRFRQTLDPSQRHPGFRRMVLAGHSMGGLISSLQIRQGGRHLWKQFTDTPPEQMNLSPQIKQHITRIVEFQPRPEIARVVFFATPHRGSDLAVNPVSDFFARLIRLPFGFLEQDRLAFTRYIREDMRGLFVAPANSIVFLRARSPLLQAILDLPMKKNVSYHSIVGDRGHGDTPESSDGVVPYWSSHLQGAVSEKIVASGHGAHEHPDGIEEFRRILRARDN